MKIGSISIRPTLYLITFILGWLITSALFGYLVLTVNIWTSLENCIFAIGGELMSLLSIAFLIYYIKMGNKVNQATSFLMLSIFFYVVVNIPNNTYFDSIFYEMLRIVGSAFMVSSMLATLIKVIKKIG